MTAQSILKQVIAELRKQGVDPDIIAGFETVRKLSTKQVKDAMFDHIYNGVKGNG